MFLQENLNKEDGFKKQVGHAALYDGVTAEAALFLREAAYVKIKS